EGDEEELEQRVLERLQRPEHERRREADRRDRDVCAAPPHQQRDRAEVAEEIQQKGDGGHAAEERDRDRQKLDVRVAVAVERRGLVEIETRVLREEPVAVTRLQRAEERQGRPRDPEERLPRNAAREKSGRYDPLEPDRRGRGGAPEAKEPDAEGNEQQALERDDHRGGAETILPRLASASGLGSPPRLEWGSVPRTGHREHPPADACVVRADRDRRRLERWQRGPRPRGRLHSRTRCRA